MLRPNRHPLIVPLYLNAALLAVLVTVLLVRSGRSLESQAFAQQPPIGGGAGVFIVPAQFTNNTWGCYLLNIDRQTICAYQYFEGQKQLRLAAARSFRHDMELTDFNTANPTPAEVKAILDKVKASGNPDKAPGTP